MPYIAMWIDGKKKKRSERKFFALRSAERFLRVNAAEPFSDDTEIYWVRYPSKRETVLGVYSLKKRGGLDYMDLDG